MKLDEIKRIFTGNVCRLLQDGWIFHIESMMGTQGEIAKTDLQKGDDVIRVLLRAGMDSIWDHFVEIVNIRFAGNAGKSTIWNRSGEILELHKFYRATDDWYTDSSEEFESIKQKRNERRDESKTFDKKLGERCNSIAWRWVKKNVKKSARLSDIVGVYRKTQDCNGFLVETKKGNSFIAMERT